MTSAVTTRENVETKGRRYLTEGRVLLRVLDEHAGIVQADVRGDGAVWSTGRDEGGWFCTCPARSRCAHLVAVGLVVVLEPREAVR